MDLGLTGRVAIVAAASKGLGRAVAEELAREGAHVAICARTAGTLEEAAAYIRKTTGREVYPEILDVSDSKAVAAFVAVVESRFGPSIFALPIPEVRRLTPLETPAQKSGAWPSISS
jgi:3-oxoacyl-[acyl-carrier protein] reductase